MAELSPRQVRLNKEAQIRSLTKAARDDERCELYRSAEKRQQKADRLQAELDAADTPQPDDCPTCGGVTEHRIGCPEMDRPR